MVWPWLDSLVHRQTTGTWRFRLSLQTGLFGSTPARAVHQISGGGRSLCTLPQTRDPPLGSTLWRNWQICFPLSHWSWQMGHKSTENEKLQKYVKNDEEEAYIDDLCTMIMYDEVVQNCRWPLLFLGVKSYSKCSFANRLDSEVKVDVFWVRPKNWSPCGNEHPLFWYSSK